MTIFERLFKRGIESGCMSVRRGDGKGMWGWYFYIRKPSGDVDRENCDKYSGGVRWLKKRARELYPPKQLPQHHRRQPLSAA